MKASKGFLSIAAVLKSRLRMTVFNLVSADANGPFAVAAVVLIVYLLTHQWLA